MTPFAWRWWVRALRIPSTQRLLEAFGHALAACGLSFGAGQEKLADALEHAQDPVSLRAARNALLALGTEPALAAVRNHDLSQGIVEPLPNRQDGPWPALTADHAVRCLERLCPATWPPGFRPIDTQNLSWLRLALGSRLSADLLDDGHGDRARIQALHLGCARILRLGLAPPELDPVLRAAWASPQALAILRTIPEVLWSLRALGLTRDEVVQVTTSIDLEDTDGWMAFLLLPPLLDCLLPWESKPAFPAPRTVATLLSCTNGDAAEGADALVRWLTSLHEPPQHGLRLLDRFARANEGTLAEAIALAASRMRHGDSFHGAMSGVSRMHGDTGWDGGSMEAARELLEQAATRLAEPLFVLDNANVASLAGTHGMGGIELWTALVDKGLHERDAAHLVQSRVDGDEDARCMASLVALLPERMIDSVGILFTDFRALCRDAGKDRAKLRKFLREQADRMLVFRQQSDDFRAALLLEFAAALLRDREGFDAVQAGGALSFAELSEEECCAFLSAMVGRDPSANGLRIDRAKDDGEAEALREKILSDEFGMEDWTALVASCDAGRAMRRLEFVVHKAIPAEGSRRGDSALLWASVREGDLRSHLAAPLRTASRRVEVSEGRRCARKPRADKLDVALAGVAELLTDDRQEEPALLVWACEKYLDSPRSKRDREVLLTHLCRRAASHGVVHAWRHRLCASTPVEALAALEELFSDEHLIPGVLRDALHAQSRARFRSPKQPMRKARGVARTLETACQGDDVATGPSSRLRAILRQHRAEEIQAKLLDAGLLSPTAAQRVAESMADELWDTLPLSGVVDEALRDVRALIKRGLRGWETVRNDQAPAYVLELRAVKGIPWVVWGLHGGVCIARDTRLWSDPAFKLVALIDREQNQSRGVIHVYETVVDGQPAWTLPGLNPQRELLRRVQPRSLVDGMLEAVVELAREADVHRVYIPTSEMVCSNRGEVRRALHARGMKERSIDEVSWTSSYAFSRVWVVAEEEEA